MKKIFKKIKESRDFIVFVIATLLLISVSFLAGYLIGEKRLAKQLSEETKQLETLINRQKSDLEQIKEERNHTSPEREEIDSQIEDLEKLREEVENNNQ